MTLLPAKHKLSPVVLSPLSLLELIRYVLDRVDPLGSKIVVCSSHDQFLSDLSQAFESTTDPDQVTPTTEAVSTDLVSFQSLTPTLSILHKLQTYTLTFCSDVPTLRAYLASVRSVSNSIQTSVDTGGTRTDAPGKEPALVLINPLALHRPSPSFSAQGLSRTFAAAVEAALRRESKLVVAECVPAAEGPVDARAGWLDENAEQEMWADSPAFEGHGVPDTEAQVEQPERERSPDIAIEHDPAGPWEEQIPVLDVIVARRFGGTQDRPWMERSISVRSVIERWARFVTVRENGQ